MAEITLRTGELCLIDDKDVDLVRSIKSVWRYTHNGRTGNKCYVRAVIKDRDESGKFHCSTMYLHRLIMRATKGQIVDHINCDTLDNRRCNLRFATGSINSMNQKKRKASTFGGSCSSRFKGVTIIGRLKTKKWRAMIHINQEGRLHLGYFESELEAAFAYDLASLEYHGEFGRRNFLPLVI